MTPRASSKWFTCPSTDNLWGAELLTAAFYKLQSPKLSHFPKATRLGSGSEGSEPRAWAPCCCTAPLRETLKPTGCGAQLHGGQGSRPDGESAREELCFLRKRLVGFMWQRVGLEIQTRRLMQTRRWCSPGTCRELHLSHVCSWLQLRSWFFPVCEEDSIWQLDFY